MTKRLVFFDPDGTSNSEFGVVLEYATGVVYMTKCGGRESLERSVEGYFVPLGGLSIHPDRRLNPMDLRSPFHKDDSCAYGGVPSQPPVPNYSELPGHRLEQLIAAIANIPWWSEGGATDTTTRTPLALDERRLSEIVEGWVPVLTADGPGILIWPNCK